MPDPVAMAFNGLLDHIHIMDEKLKEMSQVIQKLGGDIEEMDLPTLHLEDMEQEKTGKDQGNT